MLQIINFSPECQKWDSMTWNCRLLRAIIVWCTWADIISMQRKFGYKVTPFHFLNLVTVYPLLLYNKKIWLVLSTRSVEQAQMGFLIILNIWSCFPAKCIHFLSSWVLQIIHFHFPKTKCSCCIPISLYRIRPTFPESPCFLFNDRHLTYCPKCFKKYDQPFLGGCPKCHKKAKTVTGCMNVS